MSPSVLAGLLIERLSTNLWGLGDPFIVYTLALAFWSLAFYLVRFLAWLHYLRCWTLVVGISWTCTLDFGF